MKVVHATLQAADVWVYTYWCGESCTTGKSTWFVEDRANLHLLLGLLDMLSIKYDVKKG